ncbi:MAG: type III secretion system export apparatus subunit SctR [Myxococcota bacterium]
MSAAIFLANAVGPEPTLPGQSVSLVVGLAVLSLLPFAALTLSSFVKIAVVLGIARSALGVQQLPPTPVLTGLAVILSVHVMAPVVTSAWDAATEGGRDAGEVALVDGIMAAKDPLVGFLLSHTDPEDLALFAEVANEARGEEEAVRPGSLLVVAPAFIIGELREAFRIGFLIFLPFLVVDLVVSCVLLALGMHMLSPTTVSLPFKLLLFVAADGWLLLSESLVRSYIPS